MSEILITGFEMPKKWNVGILIYADGSVEVCGEGTLSKPIYGTPTTKAIEVQTHGRLVDADEEIKRIKKMQEVLLDTEKEKKIYYEFDGMIDYLYDAPTVIEASKERE